MIDENGYPDDEDICADCELLKLKLATAERELAAARAEIERLKLADASGHHACADLETELDMERAAREKAERERDDLAREIKRLKTERGFKEAWNEVLDQMGTYKDRAEKAERELVEANRAGMDETARAGDAERELAEVRKALVWLWIELCHASDNGIIPTPAVDAARATKENT